MTVIGERPEGIEIETDRYAAFTDLAVRLARPGADFVEIAGNDDILITVLAEAPPRRALYAARPAGVRRLARQLREVKVADLAGVLRALARRAGAAGAYP